MKNQFNLITGAKGYIAEQLSLEFNKKKIQHILIDKNSNKKKIYKIDLKNTKKINKFFKKNKKKIKNVFHFGTHSALAYQNNFNESFYDDFIALKNLIENLKKIGSPKIIYLSSSYVYSNAKYRSKKLLSEKSEINPSHNFGFAKKFFEDYICKFYDNYLIFRLSSVFGIGNSIHPNAIYNLCKNAKQNKKIFIWGNGSRKMQYIYMTDVIQYLIKSNNLNGIYNLCGNEYVSLKKLSVMLRHYYDVSVYFDKSKKEGESLPKMTNNKIINKVGNFYHNFEASLKDYITKIN